MFYAANVRCTRNGHVRFGIASEDNPLSLRFTPWETVYFGQMEMRLDIPKEGVRKNGWFITPVGDITISLHEVRCQDGDTCEEMACETGRPTSSRMREKHCCTLCVQWTRPDELPVELHYKIKLLGAIPPFNFITLRIEPPSLEFTLPSQLPSDLLVPPWSPSGLPSLSPSGLPSRLPSGLPLQLQSGLPLQLQSRLPKLSLEPPQSTYSPSMLKRKNQATEEDVLTAKKCEEKLVSVATPLSLAERGEAITKEGVPPAKRCKEEKSAAMKPTLAKLMKMTTITGEKVQIINSVAPHWKQLGALLDFDDEGRTLSLIEADHQQKGHVACCQEMFTLWLNGKGKKATWEVLLELLDDIDQSELARKVKAALLS